MSKTSRVVIVGAGFGGLEAARVLSNSGADVVLIDRTNHHLFQPLLYQVATGVLSPADIAVATRSIFARAENIRVMMDDVTGIDPIEKSVSTRSGVRVPYDYLIVATGADYSFFGNDSWAHHVLTLKTLDDALIIRDRLLRSLEEADRLPESPAKSELLTYVIVGGGPTGVEMAGAIAELTASATTTGFRNISRKQIRIILIEGEKQLLKGFRSWQAEFAAKSLRRLGVEVILGHPVQEISDQGVEVAGQIIRAETVIWCAGTQARSAGGWLNAALAPNKAVKVGKDCSLAGTDNVFVLGDAAAFTADDGNVLPGLAAVAKQQGRYVGKLILGRLGGKNASTGFQYRNWGKLAIIGRAAAVADFGWIHLAGFPAWLAWSLIHIWLLVGFRNRFSVYLHWAWNWWARQNSVRLLVGAFSPSPGSNAKHRAEILSLVSENSK